MSMMSLANAAIARRSDFPPVGVPQGLSGIALAAAGHVPPASAAGSGGGAVAPTDSTQALNTAYHVIFGYIPSEILTLYVAVLAAIHTDHITTKDWMTFWCFFAATPIVQWLLYAAKVKASGDKKLPLSPKQWPLWEMFAALVAYFAWAFALPGSPFIALPIYSSAFAAIVVLVTSTVLGLLAPLFQQSIQVPTQ